jgi:hypothetical protein
MTQAQSVRQISFIQAINEALRQEMNRDPDDLNLIVYIYDNLKNMESCQHKRSLL